MVHVVILYGASPISIAYYPQPFYLLCFHPEFQKMLLNLMKVTDVPKMHRSERMDSIVVF